MRSESVDGCWPKFAGPTGAQDWWALGVGAYVKGCDQFSRSGRTAEVACRLSSASVCGCAKDEPVGGDIEGGCLVEIGLVRDVEVEEDPLDRSWRWRHWAEKAGLAAGGLLGVRGGSGSKARPGRRALAVPRHLAQRAEYVAGASDFSGDLRDRIGGFAAGLVG